MTRLCLFYTELGGFLCLRANYQNQRTRKFESISICSRVRQSSDEDRFKNDVVRNAHIRIASVEFTPYIDS